MSRTFTTIQSTTDDGRFTIVINWNPKTNEAYGEMALKIQEDAISDNLYIDSSEWIRNTFFPAVIGYEESGTYPEALLDEFSQDVIISMAMVNNQLVELYKFVELMGVTYGEECV